jgi:endonuclease/exonuclease/phosphatase family metal-dependent hydrolase
MGYKSEPLLRVASLNVGRFPIAPQAPKMNDFFSHVRRVQPDIMGFSEFGLNPLALSRQQQWSERSRGQFETLKSRIAFNEHVQGVEPTLWGGTGIMCMNRMAARVFETGQDPSGMGRWTWMRLRGKGMNLRIVSVYRPCDSSGPTSVAGQQRTILLEEDIQDNPRKVFLEDLAIEASEWIEQGDHLIILGDFNEDVRTGDVKETMEALDMTEAITEYHDDIELPATYKQNKSGTIIDGIWITRGIQVRRAGYTSFGNCDHQTVWMDIQQQSVFGHKVLPTTSLMSRRLQL